MTSARQLNQSLDALTAEIQRKVEEWERENEVELSDIRLSRIDVTPHDSARKSFPRVQCIVEIKRTYRQ